MMKAWVLHGVNDFRMKRVEKPELLEHEVMVAVKAVGICGSDIPRVFQTGTYSFPLIPGHEFSGIVVETGASVDSAWIGRRVGVFPLIPCDTCRNCRKKQYELCQQYSYLGSRRNGGFAEFVAVPAANLIALPNTVTYEEAAMMEPMAVAVHAMRRSDVSVSDTVAICGLGTIGLLILMFLREAGIENIYVIGNKEHQKFIVQKMGISDRQFCDSKRQDVDKWLMERTDGAGADVFFECVGKNVTIDQAINLTASAGRIMLVGNPDSDMRFQKATYWKILRNQLTITGTWNSSFTHDKCDDWHYVCERLEQQKIAPADLITHRIPIENLGQGLDIMRNKTEAYVKIMCHI